MARSIGIVPRWAPSAVVVDSGVWFPAADVEVVVRPDGVEAREEPLAILV